MNEPERKNELDLLRHIEWVTEEINKAVGERGKSVFRRYPFTFGMLVLFGFIAVSEGAKGILESAGALEINPLYLLLLGVVILIFTGTLYKKLDK